MSFTGKLSQTKFFKQLISFSENSVYPILDQNSLSKFAENIPFTAGTYLYSLYTPAYMGVPPPADQIFYRSCVNLQHFRSRSLAVISLLLFWTVDLFRSDMLYLFNMVWPCTCVRKVWLFSSLTQHDGDISRVLCSLFVVTP